MMKFQNEFIFFDVWKIWFKNVAQKQKVIGIGGFTLLAKKDWMLKIENFKINYDCRSIQDVM